MSRFARRNLADKSDSDESETQLVGDLEMATLEKEPSSPVEEITQVELSKSDGSETIVLVDKLETTIKELFKKNRSFWAEYGVNIEHPPLKLEESPLFRPLFRPLLIAMGPHHRALANTKQLENHKLSALQAVFGVDKVRAELFGVDNVVSLRDSLKLIEDLEERARRCYEREVHLSKEEFVKILLLDSVFILTMIILDSRGGLSKFDQEWVWDIEQFFDDLLLMENQIPFFVLEDMWDAIKEKIVEDDKIKGLSIIGLFKRAPFWAEEDSSDFNEEEETVDNLLGLYYRWNVPISPRESTRPRSQQQSSQSWFQSCIARLRPEGRKQRKKATPSATELYEAGLIFSENEYYTNMFDITFEDGVLEIPTLTIDQEIMTRITNLLCHENRNSYKESTVASYVFLMDSLIHTKEDIALLQKFGIINNKLASDEEAAAFINSLGQDCDEDESNNFYAPVIADVRDFTKSGSRRNWTSLKHTYFSNPWTGISLIAAIFLLFLSCVQTYYAVFPKK